jgi:hypothetical protein
MTRMKPFVIDDISKVWQESLVKLIRETQRFDRRTHARNRTTSSRRLAGSRRNKRQRFVGTRRSDIYRGFDTMEWGSKPNHPARFQDIRNYFPITEEQARRLVKRWA